MSYTLRFTCLFLLMAFFISCKSKPVVNKENISLTIVDSSVKIAPILHEDEIASFISGVPGYNSEFFKKLDTAVNWTHYSKYIDSLFSYGDSIRMDKIEKWAENELVRNPDIKTVFYPFSGPDFLNANIYYPEVSRYIMIGLEPIGSLPDVCDQPVDSVINYMTDIKNSLRDLLKRSYFITKKMEGDLSKSKINGTLPFICLFIKRAGYHIASINKIAVDQEGNCRASDDIKNPGKVVRGVRVDFKNPSDTNNNIKSVYYFRCDISDNGLKKYPGFATYLSSLPRSYTFLKAASYLLHFKEFSTIRKQIFDISYTILQDDSGIAYQLFNKKKWEIRLYGSYTKPKKEFAFIKEPELEKAFRNSVVRPLPYSIGYNWRSGHTSMLYAIRK